MQLIVVLLCVVGPLQFDVDNTTIATCTETRCEHACVADRPAGDAKNWGCSNHTPQHLASAREIAAISKANGCRGWKRVR
jgi:hypothetical protein